MFRFRRYALILGLAGATAGLPSVIVAQDNAQKSSDSASVAEAVRFQQAEAAAAARQAALEASRGGEKVKADKTAGEQKPTPEPTVQSAVRFQQAEDAAAARQARIDEGMNSADRMAPEAKSKTKTARPAPPKQTKTK